MNKELRALLSRRKLRRRWRVSRRYTNCDRCGHFTEVMGMLCATCHPLFTFNHAGMCQCELHWPDTRYVDRSMRRRGFPSAGYYRYSSEIDGRIRHDDAA